MWPVTEKDFKKAKKQLVEKKLITGMFFKKILWENLNKAPVRDLEIFNIVLSSGRFGSNILCVDENAKNVSKIEVDTIIKLKIKEKNEKQTLAASKKYENKLKSDKKREQEKEKAKKEQEKEKAKALKEKESNARLNYLEKNENKLFDLTNFDEIKNDFIGGSVCLGMPMEFVEQIWGRAANKKESFLNGKAKTVAQFGELGENRLGNMKYQCEFSFEDGLLVGWKEL